MWAWTCLRCPYRSPDAPSEDHAIEYARWHAYDCPTGTYFEVDD